MKMRMQFIFRTLASWVILMALAACAGTADKPLVPSDLPPQTVRGNFPRDKAPQSLALLEILKASGVMPKTHRYGNRVYRAFTIACRTQENGAAHCTFASTVDCRGKSCRHEFRDSEGLAAILYDLPVAQGDSGVASPYIECLGSEAAPGFASCSVAQEIDYSGP